MLEDDPTARASPSPRSAGNSGLPDMCEAPHCGPMIERAACRAQYIGQSGTGLDSPAPGSGLGFFDWGCVCEQDFPGLRCNISLFLMCFRFRGRSEGYDREMALAAVHD